MYYKLTNISGKSKFYHGSCRRRVKVGRVIRTIRDGQSIMLPEKDLLLYRFQNEITEDPNPNAWTKVHILLAEPILPRKKKDNKISQTPESDNPPTDNQTEESINQESLSQDENSIDSVDTDNPEATEDNVKANDPDEEEVESHEENEESEEIKEKPIDSPQVEGNNAESHENIEDDDSVNKPKYTVKQLVKMGKGEIYKIKLANKIKLPGYNSMTVIQKAEAVVKWFENNQ